MERLVHDLTYGARVLLKNKGFTVTAVVTLAVCIAANVAVFSIVNAVVLRPLPFPEADRLVTVYNSYPGAGVERAGNGVPDYYDRLRDVTALEQQAIFNDQGITIGSAGDAERVEALRVTPSLFPLLRARAWRGRFFTPEEGEIGKHQRAVLSYGLWQRRFGGRDEAVGRDIRVNGEPYTIVGVLPRDFRFTADAEEPEIYVPAAFTNEQKSVEARHSNSYNMAGRLKPGATIEQVRKQVDALNLANLDRFPEFKQIVINAGFSTKVVPLQDDLIREVKSALYLLWGGAAFVLLIGAVNIANLVLVRATARLKELATRHALGASLTRIARQLLTETTLLTLTGGALGLLLGYWTLTAIRTLGMERLPRVAEIGLDATVIVFTLVVSLVMGLFLGLVPIANIRKANLSQAFREEGRSSTGGRRARIMRNAFVTTQIAVALVLLAGAGLLFASFQRVLKVDPGFTVDGVMTARLNLPTASYKDDPALRAFATRMLEGVRALPGVEAAAVSNSVPFGDAFNASVIMAEGYVAAPGESLMAPLQIVASDGYLEAMGIRLLRGRVFDRRDSDTAPLTVIVDERLARKFWPNTDPVGKRMFRPDSPRDMGVPTDKTKFITVVGVVREVKYIGMAPTAEMDPVGACYFPAAQDPVRNAFLVVRTKSDPTAVVPALRRAVAAINPELPVYQTQTMQERLDASLSNRRTPMLLALAFAGVALLLAAVGVYGVLAYQVTQRTREIGIRMALGSEVKSIFSLVVRDGMTMVGIGVVLGLAGALAMGRGLQSQLFGIGAMDPGVISIVAVLLAVVALVACVIPAVRAARVNPVNALMDQ